MPCCIDTAPPDPSEVPLSGAGWLPPELEALLPGAPVCQLSLKWVLAVRADRRAIGLNPPHPSAFPGPRHTHRRTEQYNRDCHRRGIYQSTSLPS